MTADLPPKRESLAHEQEEYSREAGFWLLLDPLPSLIHGPGSLKHMDILSTSSTWQGDKWVKCAMTSTEHKYTDKKQSLRQSQGCWPLSTERQVLETSLLCSQLGGQTLELLFRTIQTQSPPPPAHTAGLKHP